MKNEGGELKVEVSELVLKVVRRDQVHDGVRWPGVTPHQVMAGPGGNKPHAPRSKAQSVAEPQMGVFTTYDLG